ncbi:hypothetical protein ACOTHX_21565 [Achromobacter xylosoxidans]
MLLDVHNFSVPPEWRARWIPTPGGVEPGRVISWHRDQVRARAAVDGLENRYDVVIWRVFASLVKVEQTQQLIAADRTIA